MRTDIYLPAYALPDVERVITTTLFRAADTTWEQLIMGTATPFLALSPYVDSLNCSASGAELSLKFNHELFGATQPRVGDFVQIACSGQPLFNGQVDGLTGYREAHGERTMGLSIKTRDATPLWRQTPWTTDTYPAGTEIGVIIQDVLKTVGLTTGEMPALFLTGLHTVHGDTQLADLPVWDMLTLLLQANGLEPFITASGKMTTVSRDVIRNHDLQLASEEILNITGERVRPPITHLLVKWLDPELAKTNTQTQVLAKESITAGFFKLKQERKVYWSEDRRQRAENTFMKVLSSVNDGLLPVGDEDYEQRDEFSGKITVTTLMWVPTLATATLATMLLAAGLPDGVAALGGGVTIPIGRRIEAAGQVAYFLIIMSMGTGNYEIWGDPYDYVHEVNTTEAFDQNAPAWVRLEETITSDFIMNEAHAQAMAVRELLYRSMSAHSWNVDIVDHPEIEKGDILRLPDGSRLYVNDYSRDLSHGAPAVLSVKGFRV